MSEGDVVLADLPQENDWKLRPAIVLKFVPPYDDFMLCGISTQLDLEVVRLDERIEPEDDDFGSSHLKESSLIRVGFLSVVPARDVRGKIGSISPERHERLLRRLSAFLLSPCQFVCGLRTSIFA